MIRVHRLILPLLLSLLPSLSRAQMALVPTPTLFEQISSEHSGITFFNRLYETETYNPYIFTNAYNGNGVAAGDLNGDGLPDLFFSATHLGSSLYFNKGGMKFEEAGRRSGIVDSGAIGRGVTMVDIDGDGDLDIYLCRINASNILYINNGNGTFTNRAKQYGLDYRGHTTQAVFFDYDLDGDLDLYLGLTGEALGNDFARIGDNDKLFRNNGRGTFTDVTKGAHIVDVGYCNNVSVGDIDNDGYPDIFVSNDFESRDIYYINNRNGTFRAAPREMMPHTSFSSMGSDIADFNNDGWNDLFVLEMLPASRLRQVQGAATLSTLSPIYDSLQVEQNVLQLNRGQGFLTDIASFAGTVATDWSWPVLFADFDLDGFKDLYIGNGMKRDMINNDTLYRSDIGRSNLQLTHQLGELKLKNYAFRNNRDLTFGNVSAEWGLDQAVLTNGAAYVDLDLDGDLDLVINNLDSLPFLYRNRAREESLGHYLRVAFDGTGLNRFGVGARVEIHDGGNLQMQENYPERGYLSSVDPTLLFGLGTDSMIDELTARWPGGASQTLRNVRSDQTITFHRSEASIPSRLPPDPAPLFREIDARSTIAYRHKENIYDDLRPERLLPHRLSQLGPGAAVGDVDGDGLEDIFIGNAQDSPGRLFLQTKQGRFIPSRDTAAFAFDGRSEDMGALLFDADNDGDLDLYVVSGGNEMLGNDQGLQDRFYLNDGKGHFTKTADRIPDELTSGSCVVAGDYDSDGDLDLFIGGRLLARKYPIGIRSVILRNDGGRFTDVTSGVAPELMKPSMTCSALWSDYDNDGKLDLIVAGEWEPVVMLHNDGGRFSRQNSTGLDSMRGWWNSITPGDFDDDGDMDYVVGNVGLNWRYKASPDYPIEIDAADFDGNGSLDPIVSYFDVADRKRYPIVNRIRMTGQIPSMQQKYTTFTAYGKATLQEMFPKAKLDSAYHRSATDFATSYIENLGAGRFAIRSLPATVQFAPTFGALADDFDGDGKLDLLLTGNFYDGPPPELPRYDGGYGMFLEGNGNGTFTPLPAAKSGIRTPGDARGIVTLRNGESNRAMQIVLNNNGAVQIFGRDASLNGSRLYTVDRHGSCTHAIVTFADGHIRRYEFPHGSGYLTESSPTITITSGMRSLSLYSGPTLLRQIQL